MNANLDGRLGQWRAAISRSAAVSETDADELESHLRDSIDDLQRAGLDDEEAFLIAVRRLGATDAVTAEFAREHGDRLWKQLVLAPVISAPTERRSLRSMLAFAAVAAVVIQVARLLAEAASGLPGQPAGWFTLDLTLFVLPVLAGYFVWLRRPPMRAVAVLAGVVGVLAVVMNVYPFDHGPGYGSGQSGWLAAGHLAVVLWFVVAAAYLGGATWTPGRRMDAVRFTGEWMIYYVLIALGGGVLTMLTSLVLAPIAPDAVDDVLLWVLPSGAAAATVVAAWLVEAKKSIIENIAPVLTAIFTPLFAVALVVGAIGYLAAGVGREFDRDLLVVFDVLLVVVVALVLYGLSARDPLARTGPMDVIRLVAVIAAIVLDVLVLGSMLARIGEYGLTPNRVAALGVNLLLVADLVGTVVLGARRSVAGVGRMTAWQTGFLPVFGGWAAFVVVGIPPIFGFA